MHEISYSEFQTLIEKQSDMTYKIVRDNKDNPDYSSILQQICNIMYAKTEHITFAVDDITKPNIIHIVISKNNETISENLKIIYSDYA